MQVGSRLQLHFMRCICIYSNEAIDVMQANTWLSTLTQPTFANMEVCELIQSELNVPDKHSWCQRQMPSDNSGTVRNRFLAGAVSSLVVQEQRCHATTERLSHTKLGSIVSFSHRLLSEAGIAPRPPEIWDTA